MKTGIELIAEERAKQILKGRTLDFDKDINRHGQLIEAASVLCFPHIVFADRDAPTVNWDKKVWKKLISKPHMERLIISGALIAAEIDRLNNNDVDDLHNKIMVQWEKDFGSIHNDQKMDAYTVSGFIRKILKCA